MNELILTVSHRGSSLEIDGKSLVYRQPRVPMQRYPLGLLSQVIVLGNCLLDAKVYRVLAERNVAMVLLPSRGHGQGALNAAAIIGGCKARRLQHRASQQQRLTLAKQIVADKVSTYSAVAHQHLKQEIGTSLDETNKTIRQAADIATLMGVEGAQARLWYRSLEGFLPQQWAFSGRNRRPPQDPINALLSLGYSLLNSVAYQAVAAAGLDPAEGVLHQNYPGRMALVLDVCEPFRAGIDCFVLEFIESVSPDGFTKSEVEGCRLSKETARHYFKQWALLNQHWYEPLAEITKTDSEISAGLFTHLYRYCKFIRGQYEVID